MGPAPEPEMPNALAPAEITILAGADSAGWRVHVRGEIDIASSPRLKRQLEQVADDDGPIVVDVSEMTFIDSSGLGVLVEILKRRRDAGLEPMRIQGVQEPVRRVFEITGLTSLFDLD